MQRQQSIHSFFQKCSPANKSGAAYISGARKDSNFTTKQRNPVGDASGQPTVSATEDSSLEIRGTDTPPEKVPRQILPSGFKANEGTSGGSSLFSSIMHKFVKVDARQNANKRYFAFLKL